MCWKFTTSLTSLETETHVASKVFIWYYLIIIKTRVTCSNIEFANVENGNWSIAGIVIGICNVSISFLNLFSFIWRDVALCAYFHLVFLQICKFIKRTTVISWNWVNWECKDNQNAISKNWFQLCKWSCKLQIPILWRYYKLAGSQCAAEPRS